jgi:hypothetical protein
MEGMRSSVRSNGEKDGWRSRRCWGERNCSDEILDDLLEKREGDASSEGTRSIERADSGRGVTTTLSSCNVDSTAFSSENDCLRYVRRVTTLEIGKGKAEW